MSTILHSPAWSVSSWSSPARGARYGGDWCDAFAISDDAIALTVGDVSGHGESVAETMEIIRQAVLLNVQYDAEPSRVLSAANAVAHSKGNGIVATAIAAVLNHRLRTLTFANAGHPPPLMMTPTRHGFLRRAVGDLPLGISQMHSAADHVVALPEDALLVFYTDGITEHNRDPLCGERELVEACRGVYGSPVPDLATVIAQRIFKRRRGYDDAAVTILRELSQTDSAG